MWPWEEAGLQTLLCWAGWQGLPRKEGPHPPSLLVTPLGRGPGCAHQQECLQLVDVDLLAGQEAGEHQLPHLQPFASISLALCNTARSPAQPAVSMAQSPSSPSPSISRGHIPSSIETPQQGPGTCLQDSTARLGSWGGTDLLGLEPSTAGSAPGQHSEAKPSQGRVYRRPKKPCLKAGFVSQHHPLPSWVFSGKVPPLRSPLASASLLGGIRAGPVPGHSTHPCTPEASALLRRDAPSHDIRHRHNPERFSRALDCLKPTPCSKFPSQH